MKANAEDLAVLCLYVNISQGKALTPGEGGQI